MRKLNKKKLLLGIAAVLVLFMAAFYIFTNFIYLPGIHIWWRFCSINIEKNCYWYNEESQEFTGKYSPIKIKVTGFYWPAWLPFRDELDDLKGEIEIADYPIYSEGHDALLMFTHVLNGLKGDASIYVLESYAVIDDANVAHPNFGKSYYLWFAYPDVPEYIKVYLFEEREPNSGPKTKDKTGYVADNLEEAKAMQELEMKKKP